MLSRHQHRHVATTGQPENVDPFRVYRVSVPDPLHRVENVLLRQARATGFREIGNPDSSMLEGPGAHEEIAMERPVSKEKA